MRKESDGRVGRRREGKDKENRRREEEEEWEESWMGGKEGEAERN